MKILERLRKRAPRTEADAVTPGVETDPAADTLAIPGYDELGHKEIGDRLHRLTQVELAGVETYERAHRNRPEVLDKLRYMRSPEPLLGYDALDAHQIADALVGADAAIVRAVRDYERRFAQRPQVLDETARVLPSAPAGADEAQAQEERTARVREGFASRDETAGDLAERRTEPDH